MSTRIIYATVDIGTGLARNALGFAIDKTNLRFQAGDENAAILRLTLQTSVDANTVLPFVVSDSAVKTLTMKKVTGVDSNNYPTFSTTALLLAENDQWDQSGDWDGRSSAQGQHSVRLNTNTTSILTDVASGSIVAIVEIEIDDPTLGNSSLPTFQCLIVPQVHTGAEGVPASPDPLYATKVYAASLLAALFERDENGDVWVKDSSGNRVNKLT